MTTQEIADARLLADSFTTFLRYRNDYDDDNPLEGEPGTFMLSKSKDKEQQQSLLQQQQREKGKDADKDAPGTTATGTDTSATNSKTGTPVLTPAGSPAVGLKLDTITAAAGQKATGQKGPATPGSARDKERAKRRKSKVAGAGGAVSTPK